jgi:hypothetical protein
MGHVKPHAQTLQLPTMSTHVVAELIARTRRALEHTQTGLSRSAESSRDIFKLRIC